jgi:hypothetical protein
VDADEAEDRIRLLAAKLAGAGLRDQLQVRADPTLVGAGRRADSESAR